MKILFVCTGNICRSPSAEAIARKKAEERGLDHLIFDSAGTSGYHEGEPSDKRTVEVGEQNGVSFKGIAARQINDEDFDKFDLILAMDRSHLSHLYNIAPAKHHDKIALFLQFCNVSNFHDDEVIDPYYGAGRGFIEVFELIDRGLDNLFEMVSV